MFIDHVTIRTADLAATRDFFINLFDLQEKDRPLRIQRIPGHWLFDNKNQPLIHLIAAYGNHQPVPTGEAIDHVGIGLQGRSDFIKKLRNFGIPYSLMELPEINERRVFFYAPGGVLLEAVFKNETETEGDQI